ncbi:hypothetical protein FRC11_005295 [Ceratobasidium sp. 423]|nr:hypothetical protein FRC11_005295 [Ceratobasidium sp. 423]
MAPTTRSSKRRATEVPLDAPESSQLATAPEGDAYAESSSGRPDTPESEAEPDPKPVRKRARRVQKDKGDTVPVKAPKQGRVKGKLEVFKNVPVEVFIEIAKYLHPFDLVLLSRVNKFFRELFMSRQAASIWTSARQSVPGLPPCPPELCEPQYAALLFTKMCSQCGKYAPRHMDPTLLVRLCSKCREEQYKLGMTTAAKITDLTLVARSSEPTPRNLRHYGRLYLSSDVEAVESKLKELKAAGDKDALIRWQNERRKALQDRYANAKLFFEWFADRDSEREADLNQRKDAHEAEVEARLISLGWEEVDHLPYTNPRRKQWLSLVRTAKVLTDRAWDKLLPQLLVHLKTNREERLERERAARRRDRQQVFHDFWCKAKEKLPPLLQATAQQSNLEATSPPVAVLEKNTLHQSFPSFTRLREWPEYQQLMDEDISGTELELRLPKKQDSFNEFIQKWRTQLEETLIQQLPDYVEPPDFNPPDLSLSADEQPADSLFAGTQMLLRADVAFKKAYSSCSFYPDDFRDLFYDSSQSPQIYYARLEDQEQHIWKSNLWDVFFNAVDVSVLQARSVKLGRILSSWNSQSKILENAGTTHASKEFTYIFTHDMKVERLDKPLVRIADESEAPAPLTYNPYGSSKLCLACYAIGTYASYSNACINEHLRDAHLIEEPEQGKHFR